MKRSLNHRNFVGGFVGGVLGILLLGWAGTFVGLIACLLGFCMGFYYDRIAATIGESARQAREASRKKTRAARARLWQNRVWGYALVLTSSIFSHVIEQGTTERSTELIVPITLIIIMILCLFSATSRTNSDAVFNWMTDMILCAFVLVAFVLPQEIVNSYRDNAAAFKRTRERLRIDAEYRLTWAHRIAGLCYSTIILGLYIEGIVLGGIGKSGSFEWGLIGFGVCAMSLLSQMMFFDAETPERIHLIKDETERARQTEAFQARVHAQRLHKLETLGFARYTAGFAARMFTVLFAFALEGVWAIGVFIPMMLFWALGISMPVMFAWLLIKNLPRVSDGTHWVGMLTTLAVTGVTAAIFNGALAGYALLAVAFANGLACGALSVGVCRLAGRSHKLVPALASFSSRFKNGSQALDYGMEPFVRRFDNILFFGPLAAPLRALMRQDNFGL